ncbi:MAG TPA: histidinol dehydrogenase [Candidatus Hydrogenedentes bacterium]|nr:histidinol dehydrogenase [Candidatus Hydrogenedentota bacterium]
MDIFEIRDDAAFQTVAEKLRGPTTHPDAEETLAGKLAAVRAVIEAVRARGDEAVAEFTQQFDGVTLRPKEFEVPQREIDAAVDKVEPILLATLEKARDNIEQFHSKNLRQSWEETLDDGSMLGQRITPVERVGVYVPGGKAYYPSSVLMNIVPAKVAGVSEIVMVSPPSFEGGIHPVVLAAAKLAGATRVFRIGGAQAVAALAYGTKHVPGVLKITGPGNIYVTLAKRLVSSVCAIDAEAGPSEVVVIADDAANPRYVALELLAQAEHEEEACAILITPSKSLAERVLEEIENEKKTLTRKEYIDAALHGQGMIIITRSLDEAAELSNLFAPEHLSIQTASPRDVLGKITNAGAIMLGDTTPVAVGDYLAGPNHILPTARRARFASPLTAEDFRKVTSVMSYSRERMQQDAPDIQRLAEAEGLTAHARAAEIRR